MREEKLRNARLYNNDKNPIHLPRQCLRDGTKALSLLVLKRCGVEVNYQCNRKKKARI